MIKLLRLVLVCCLFVVSISAYAGVSVFPQQIFITPQNRSAPLFITNGSDAETEVWITFTGEYPIGFQNGKITFEYADTLENSPSAVSWVKAVPERLVLAAREKRTVRLFVTPPLGLTEGEYWARVIVHDKATKVQLPKASRPGMRLAMQMITETGIPFHVRRGTPRSGVIVKGATASLNKNMLSLKLDLERRGNSSFWGRLNYRLMDDFGKTVQKKEFRLVVYKAFSYVTDIDITGIPSGTYRIDLVIDDRHPDLTSEYRIKSESVAHSATISIP